MPPAPLQIPGALVAILRKRQGWSSGHLAFLVGTTQQTIDKIERDLIKHSKFFAGIKEALGITPKMITDYLTKGSGFTPMDLPLEPEATLPLYVTCGRINLNTYCLLKHPDCKILRPPMLKGSNDAYALLMPDDSMMPEFRAGDTLAVQPSAPPQLGASHVFSNEALNYKVRKLVAITEDYYLVRAHNSGNDGGVGGDRVPASWDAHLIVGRYLHYEP